MPTPTRPLLYAKVKAEAKEKFDVWPSAYASGWLVQEYKRRGGTYMNPSMNEEWVHRDEHGTVTLIFDWLEWAPGYALIADLEVASKRRGHGSRLVSLAADEVCRRGGDGIIVPPRQSDEAERFWASQRHFVPMREPGYEGWLAWEAPNNRNPETGLTKWFGEEWVDLGRSIDRKGHIKTWVPCGRPDASHGKYPKCVPKAKAKKMTPKQRLSAVQRKRAAEKLAPEGKGRAPIHVKTFNPYRKERGERPPRKTAWVKGRTCTTGAPARALVFAEPQRSGFVIYEGNATGAQRQVDADVITSTEPETIEYMMRWAWGELSKRDFTWDPAEVDVEENPKRRELYIKPNQAAVKIAKRALERRKKLPKSKRGGLDPMQAYEQGIGSGVMRARDIANGKKINAYQVKAFFDRHRTNFVNANLKGLAWEDSKALQSWDLWGGEPLRKQVEKAVAKDKMNRKSNPYRKDKFQYEGVPAAPQERFAHYGEFAAPKEDLMAGWGEYEASKQPYTGDLILGGLADRRRPEDFDPIALAKGTAVEMEHTDDPEVAREIAMDHLAEDPDYYEYLEAMERVMARKRMGPAMIVSKSQAERILGRPLKSLGDLKARDKGKRSYYVLSESGKNMGGPYTMLGAKERLRQVEAFKHMRNPVRQRGGIYRFLNPIRGKLRFVEKNYRPEVAAWVRAVVLREAGLSEGEDTQTSWELEINQLASDANRIFKAVRKQRISEEEGEAELVDLEARFVERVNDFNRMDEYFPGVTPGEVQRYMEEGRFEDFDRLRDYFPDMTPIEIWQLIDAGIHMRDTELAARLSGGYIVLENRPDFAGFADYDPREAKSLAERADFREDVMRFAPFQHWVGEELGVCLQCWHVNFAARGLGYIKSQERGDFSIFVILDSKGRPRAAANVLPRGRVRELLGPSNKELTGEMADVGQEFLEVMGFVLIRDLVRQVQEADPQQLKQMRQHPFSEVRVLVAATIDPEYLPGMIDDENAAVRISVAERIAPEYLPQMMDDESEDVRQMVARRIDPEYLPQMMGDESEYVRALVALRIDPEYLPRMMNDDGGEVRHSVAVIIDPEYLPQMMGDEDPGVRERVARRIDPEYLPQMMDDEDGFVRELVAERMEQLSQNPRRRRRSAQLDELRRLLRH